MFTVKIISPTETFAVRHPVLRPGKPIETCIFDGDALPTTVHFGIFHESGPIAGVVSVFEAPHTFFTEQKQFQLRGMAVLAEYQKTGLGEQLVLAAEEYARNNNGQRIWFNAREIAIGFYRKMGYETTGVAFSVGDIGIHYVMHKPL
ncbi:acetyltransferase [Flavobacterium akiainvivens]|uniref:Acetyltransferase n=1 Tax=Flavobacterium akiainvivens TaxID=1202724 RepID=A0A0M8MCG5_9FLAO|nr:GNAT family N-acetyltransferase [Flavobacterium akiainvivens]KOS08323.1 acetyltransferase [Flavobacterium akiainvivens]